MQFAAAPPAAPRPRRFAQVVVVDEEEVAQVHAVAPPPPPLSRQNATESARRSSARQASANATRGAVSYPQFASVRHIYLEDSTKIGLQTLFGVLDKTADGVIDGADFGPQFGSRRTMALWERLRDEFDEDSSGSIDPVEFISGFKRLAMMQPLDQSAFTKVAGGMGWVCGAKCKGSDSASPPSTGTPHQS